MWKCKKCGEEIEDNFDTCWNCGTSIEGKVVKHFPETDNQYKQKDVEEKNIQDIIPQNSAEEKISKKLIKRYQDAYNIAKSIIAFGNVIKFCGIIIGIITVFIGSNLSNFFGSGNIGVSSIFFAILIGGSIYLLGTIITAQGQIMQATLDTAVNSSSFLNEDERIKAMRL